MVAYDYWKLDERQCTDFVADPYQISFFKSDIPSRAAASTKANEKKAEKVRTVEKMAVVEENEEEEEEDDEDFTAEEGDTGSDPGSEPSDQEEEEDEEEEDEEVEPKVSL